MGESQTKSDALKFISLLSQDRIKAAFRSVYQQPSFHAALRAPSAPLSSSDVIALKSVYESPEGQLARMLMKDKAFGTVFGAEVDIFKEFKPGIESYERVHAYNDGTEALLGIPHKRDLSDYIFPRSASSRAPINDKKAAQLWDSMAKTSDKLGLPKTAAEMSPKNAKVQHTMKGALVRHAARKAAVNGMLTSGILTMVFDIKMLWDGDFKGYVTKVTLGALHGGAVEGLSKYIDHKFFGNGMVVGILVGTAFQAVSFAQTGDVERFCKDIGLNIVGTAASMAGAKVGAQLGMKVPGPLGVATTVLGGIVGGFCGNYMVQTVVGHFEFLSRATDPEVETAYDRIKQQLSGVGLEPDPSLPKREVVETMFKTTSEHTMPFPVRMLDDVATAIVEYDQALSTLESLAPDAFETFVELLRFAVQEQGQSLG